MSEEEPPQSGSGCAHKCAWLLGIMVVILIVDFVGASATRAYNLWESELPIHLIFGSIIHAMRALYHFVINLPHLMTVAFLPCLAAAVVLRGAHRLILWWRFANGNESGWHFKHTALVGALVMLGSAAAIAFSGVVHEAACLPQGEFTKRNPSLPTVAMNNAHLLGPMLLEYQDKHGKLPSSLLDINGFTTDLIGLRRLIFVDLDTTGPPEPFVLLRGGRTMRPYSSEMIMIGPQIPENGMFAVLKADGLVSILRPDKFIEVVKSANDATPDEK